MHTLVDFITYVKGVEYVLCVSAIAGFLFFWETLKPSPFSSVFNAGRDDLNHIGRSGGMRLVLKSVGRLAAAPFIGLAYIVMLPIGFFAVLTVTLVNAAVRGAASIAGKSAAFEWRPMEAYLAGKRKKRKQDDGTGKNETK